MTTFSSSRGRATLCFLNEGKWFQGYFICATSRVQLGLMGEEVAVDDCVACPDGGYQEYRLTVLHFALEKETQVIVGKTGGNFCRLNSDVIEFWPSMSLTDYKAVEAIEKYFPSIAERVNHNVSLLQECTVCFGDMNITALPFSS
ncbi:hypothetical protein CCR75_004166 [Bremia lactucae]|uniref:Uncharacterized protein n=1 Tax=Bremia lactucae TaxID=4779 RepID=A0A976FL03_BRELC|nr:hypothetical protein CCR75_004166 [Bremia lactucae]